MLDFPSAERSRDLVEDTKAYIRNDLLDPNNSLMKTIKNGIRLECINLRYEYSLSISHSLEYVKEMVIALNEIFIDDGYEITFWQDQSNGKRGVCFKWSKE
jgi:hypothetical protein